MPTQEELELNKELRQRLELVNSDPEYEGARADRGRPVAVGAWWGSSFPP